MEWKCVDCVADSKTWSEVLQEAVNKEELGVIPYELKLDYDYWNYRMCGPEKAEYILC